MAVLLLVNVRLWIFSANEEVSNLFYFPLHQNNETALASSNEA